MCFWYLCDLPWMQEMELWLINLNQIQERNNDIHICICIFGWRAREEEKYEIPHFESYKNYSNSDINVVNNIQSLFGRKRKWDTEIKGEWRMGERSLVSPVCEVRWKEREGEIWHNFHLVHLLYSPHIREKVKRKWKFNSQFTFFKLCKSLLHIFY